MLARTHRSAFVRTYTHETGTLASMLQRVVLWYNVNQYAQKEREGERRERKKEKGEGGREKRGGREREREINFKYTFYETYATKPHITMDVVREKISYYALINYTWFWF